MVNTPSNNVNNNFAASLSPFAKAYSLNDDQTNAAKHAIASAVYSEAYGPGISSFLGGLLETVHGGFDTYRDYVNNAFGRAIQKAYPGKTPEQYHQAIAHLAARGYLYTPTGKYGKLTPEEVAKHLAAKALQEVEVMGLFNPGINPGYDKCFLEGTQIDMWDGTQKPIETIAPDDVVTSYDKEGALVPGKVKRTFQNRVKHILDVHGLMVTPGHSTFCAKVEGEENRFADTHVPILDIIRSDGALAKKDGSLIRAGTGAPVGSIEDRFIWVITGDRDTNGYVKIREKGKIRLGTRHIMPNGEIKCLLNIIGQSGLLITADGLLIDGPSAQTGQPFHWTLSPSIPKPEDYVLQRSAVTLEEIYTVGEWESTGPQMPVPYRGEAGASYVNNPHVLQAGVDNQPPNIPLSMRDHPNQPTMNRQQRRALKRKEAKLARKRSMAH